MQPIRFQGEDCAYHSKKASMSPNPFFYNQDTIGDTPAWLKSGSESRLTQSAGTLHDFR